MRCFAEVRVLKRTNLDMNYRCAYGASLLSLLVVDVALASAGRDCRHIVSSLERLACFDEVAGTPGRVAPPQQPFAGLHAPSHSRVMANEGRRGEHDLTFLSNAAEPGASDGLMISAPAIASATPQTYLAISCVQNISRLQLISGRAIDARWVRVQLQGERNATSATAWQVMENGQVLDAGRGLPAIEQIKQLIGAHRIRVLSDNPQMDGLTFDAQGLDPLINQARSACRW
ncbi:type VI secretion system-associated protein VasI [Pseudomonas farsensis]|uniref:Type VI secretion system-associated protein VasI n=1 Tax=Pseudomonas farsensis TaxID=2745492 RepID=A0ABU8QMS5_9PSED